MSLAWGSSLGISFGVSWGTQQYETARYTVGRVIDYSPIDRVVPSNIEAPLIITSKTFGIFIQTSSVNITPIVFTIK